MVSLPYGTVCSPGSCPPAHPHIELLLPAEPRAGPSPGTPDQGTGAMDHKLVTLGSHSPSGKARTAAALGLRVLGEATFCLFDPVSDTE